MKVIGNEDQDGKFVATASGTLSNGAVVTINSAGTVSVISDTNQLLGDSVDPSGSGISPSHTSVTYDPDTDRYILFYTDGGNSSYGTAVVGQVDGTTITFGTPVAKILCHSNGIFSVNGLAVLIILYNQLRDAPGALIIPEASGSNLLTR